MKTWVVSLFTVLHVTLVRRAARWGGQTLIALEQVECLVHTWALWLDLLDSLGDRLSFHFPHHIMTCQLSRLRMQEKRLKWKKNEVGNFQTSILAYAFTLCLFLQYHVDFCFWMNEWMNEQRRKKQPVLWGIVQYVLGHCLCTRNVY